MKEWKTPDIKELDLKETANGFGNHSSQATDLNSCNKGYYPSPSYDCVSGDKKYPWPYCWWN